jgi:signal transduction histidine kinase/DNA-binding response OmpR family regulator
MLFFASIGKCADVIEDNRKYIDSLGILTNLCTTDSCRFVAYSQYFWQNYYTMDKAISTGQLAVELSKKSKSEFIQSAGFDIAGAMFEHLKMYDSAFHAYSKMLSLSLKLNNHSQIYWGYYHLGINQAGMGNTDSALYYFRKQYDYDILCIGSSGTYPMLHEIAKVFNYSSGNIDSAMVYFDNIILYSQQQNDPGLELDAYMAGIYFYSKINNTEKKVKFLNKAIAIAEDIHDEKAKVKIYIQVADMFFRQNDNYKVALEYYQKALDLSPPQDTLIKASILNEIGALYLEYGKDSLSLSSTQQALKYADEIGFKDEIFESYLNFGKIYYYRGELPKAIENFKICLEIGCDFCQNVDFHSTIILIANIYSELNQPDKALEYYLESYKLAEETGTYKQRAISNLNLGNYFRLSNPTLAEKYYITANENAEKGDDIYVLKAVCDKLSSFYKTKKDFKTAYKYISRSVYLNDSIYKINQQANMANWELKFEIDKINQANVVSVEEIKRQKTFRNSLLIITLLLIGFGFVIYISYRRKKNDNKLLTGQKNQIEEKNQEILSQVEEITSQKAAIEKISGELHKADEMKLRFFANLSHEFRTPLTLILNPAKTLLETSPLDGEGKKHIEYIYTNAQKLDNLTNQIMELQKLDAGKLQLNNEEDDIIKYCTGLISSFESLCNTKKLKIRLQANYSSVFGLFDKDKTGKIITNLLSNAIKFSFPETTIDVKIELLSDWFHLSITDKGVGIPSNEINNVYERYFQATSNKLSEGTGIGLAYVKELTNFMKGEVFIESAENKGTTITVNLPIKISEIPDKHILNMEISSILGSPTIKEIDLSEYQDENKDKELVLLVEDNDELRDYISKLFKENFRLILATNGEEGIQAALNYIPDIIISDVMMPGINGLELCTRLKNDEHTSHIPILLLTAKDTPKSSLEGYLSGADDYILKPFDSELLKLKVGNILNTRAAISKQFNSDLNTLPGAGSYSDIDKNFMARCIKIILENLNNSLFSVENLASELAFSRSNLYRKVISLTTYNPAQLIRNIRMQHAAKLLKTTSMRVNEVAMEVGYDNANKFSQAFKKHHGVLPSQIQ